MILRSVDDQNDVSALRTVYDFYRALLSNSRLTEESFNETQQQTINTCTELLNALQPWSKRTLTEVQQNSREALVADYRELCGDTGDPAFAAKVAHDVEMLRARGAKAEEAHAAFLAKIEEQRRQQFRRLREKARRP